MSIHILQGAEWNQLPDIEDFTQDGETCKGSMSITQLQAGRHVYSVGVVDPEYHMGAPLTNLKQWEIEQSKNLFPILCRHHYRKHINAVPALSIWCCVCLNTLDHTVHHRHISLNLGVIC